MIKFIFCEVAPQLLALVLFSRAQLVHQTLNLVWRCLASSRKLTLTLYTSEQSSSLGMSSVWARECILRIKSCISLVCTPCSGEVAQLRTPTLRCVLSIPGCYTKNNYIFGFPVPETPLNTFLSTESNSGRKINPPAGAEILFGSVNRPENTHGN